MRSASVKRFVASFLILAQFAGVLRAQAPNPGFTDGHNLATQSRFRTGSDIDAGRPGGVPLNVLLPESSATLGQSAYTTPEQVKEAAIQRKRDCYLNPNRATAAERMECEAINFLQGQEAQREELRFGCEQLARNKPPAEVPPECRQILDRPAMATGTNPFVPTPMRSTDESVAFANRQDMAQLKERFSIEQGQFSGCTTRDIVVSPAKTVARTCSFQDKEISQQNCSWTDPGGSYAQACAALDSSSRCEVRNTESQCVETRKVNGVDTCVKLQYTASFACASGTIEQDPACASEASATYCAQETVIDGRTVCLREESIPSSTCSPPSAADCTESIKGTCISGTHTYRCKVEDEKKLTERSCGQQKFCLSGNCFDTPQPSAMGDALVATTTMEAARQAGQYFEGELQIFKGINEKCTRKFLKNCCTKGAGAKAQSNASVMTQLGFASTAYFGSQAYMRFSPYVFDFMYSNSIFSEFAFSGLESALAQQAAATNFTSLGSFYGVTAWSGASTVAPGFMHGMSVPGFGQVSNMVTSQFSVGSFNFGFDPMSLMFAVAIQVLMSFLTCDQADIVTNMHRESRLCTYVGEYCSKRIPIIRVCYEWKKSYCCYNSRLARIISEQGRPQVGKGYYGSANGPDCSGFTADEFSRLDFSRMDLREFYSEIIPTDIPAMSGAFESHGIRRVNEMSR